MNEEIEVIQKKDTPEQIQKRNKKAILLISIIVTIFVAGIAAARFFFLNNRANFGSVDGVSTQSVQNLTKINFIDSGSIRSTAGIFGAISSPFTPDFTDKFWIKFNSADKTIIGYLDSELKFSKAYELPGTIKLVKRLDDNSILFTDEPLKDQPALYYQQIKGDTVKFSSLNFQDTFLSIYFDPSEKLIYYVEKDNTNTYFLYSVNEKGKESLLFKTGDLTSKVRIINMNSANAYFEDNNVCYKLNFLNKKLEQIACEGVSKNDLNLTFDITPKPQPVYSNTDPAEILRIDNISVSRNSLYSLQPNQVISKFSYSGNKIIFSRASLNPAGESIFMPKDIAVELLNLENNQITEVTTKFPNGVTNNFFTFQDKFIALGGDNNSKLTFYVPNGMAGQVYVGDVAPVSFTTLTKYWIDIDLGMNSSNIEVLSGDFLL